MSLTPKDLVWYNEGGDGDIKSGGYSVDSLFKTLGVSPMTTDNGNVSLMTGGGNGKGKSAGGKVSDMFRNTAIPAGLTLMSGGGFGSNDSNAGRNDIQHAGGGLIPESLFDKLTKLASPDNLLTQETKSSKTTTKPSKKHRVTKKKTKSGNGNDNTKSKRRNTKKRTK